MVSHGAAHSSKKNKKDEEEANIGALLEDLKKDIGKVYNNSDYKLGDDNDVG